MDSSKLLSSLSVSFSSLEHNFSDVLKILEHFNRHFGPGMELVHFALKLYFRMDFLVKLWFY